MRVSDRCSPVIAEEGRIEEDFRLGAKRLTELGREGRLQPLDPLILDSIVLGTLNQLLCLHFAGYLMLDRGVLEAGPVRLLAGHFAGVAPHGKKSVRPSGRVSRFFCIGQGKGQFRQKAPAEFGWNDGTARTGTPPAAGA